MTLKGTSESDSLRLYLCVCFSVAQSCHVQLFAILRTAARQASLSFTISWSLLQLMSIELMMPPNRLIHCQLLLLLPSILPSIRVFSNDSALHSRWPKYWSFSISPSNEYSGFISFRSDWFDFLAVQGTLKNPLCVYTQVHVDEKFHWALIFPNERKP